MRPAIEAALVSSLSIALTVLIMAVVFPIHALGGGASSLEAPSVQPAVFVHGTHERPGAGMSPTDSGATGEAAGSACPYLAAVAAASKCPMAPKSSAAAACPFLSKLREKGRAPSAPPVRILGQHT